MFEERYYYNGVYINLNDLPIEEYMKSPFCGCNGDGDSSEDSNKQKNQITVLVTKDENNGKIYYQVKSEYPVTSFLEITVFSTTDIKTVLEMHVGETESQLEEGDTKDILSVKMNISEDNNYKYIIMTQDIDEYVIYKKAVPVSEELTNPNEQGFNKINLKLNNTDDIVFIIPSTDIDINNFESEDELNSFIRDNQYRFILVLPNKIYTQQKYIIYNSINIDVTNKFLLVENKKTVIDNIEYIYLYEGATDEQTMSSFVPQYNEDTIYKYKLSLIK